MNVVGDLRLWCLAGRTLIPPLIALAVWEAAEVRGRIVITFAKKQRLCTWARERRQDAEDSAAYRTANESWGAYRATLTGDGNARGFDGVAVYRQMLQIVATGEGRLLALRVVIRPMRALAALRVAETLSALGFTGPITITWGRVGVLMWSVAGQGSRGRCDRGRRRGHPRRTYAAATTGFA